MARRQDFDAGPRPSSIAPVEHWSRRLGAERSCVRRGGHEVNLLGALSPSLHCRFTAADARLRHEAALRAAA